jgi:4'-phosphopantetheinyl transferase
MTTMPSMHTTDTHTDADCWRSPPASPALGSDEVHVWRFELDLPDPVIDSHFAVLSQDERERAQRFVFKKDRSHYIAARAAVRRTLGRYLQADPASLQFVYAARGKPSLSPQDPASELKFNVSHSAGIALLALSLSRDVGVDVERIRDDFPGLAIAHQFFTAAEYAALSSIEPARMHEAFFNCWTRKEAFIKAIGDGLSYPLKQFEVSLLPGEPARLLSIDGQAALAARYSLHGMVPRPGYVGALAVAGGCSSVLLWSG